MARKRPKDPSRLHGHRVVTGPELRATLVEPGPQRPGQFGRRLAHGIVLVLLLGVLAAGIVGAVAILNGQIKVPSAVSPREPTSLCPTATFDYLPNDQVKVNVFNGTSRPGLAKTVADQFQARGHQIGEVGNKGTGYTGVAVVVSGAAGQAAAFNVQRNLAGTDYFQDVREDSSVDVIITDEFSGLVAPELVDQTPGKLSCPREDKRIADNARWPVIPTAGRTP
ncbi:LytR C-terminal domain-containing protein [Arthrobacter sp. ISL-30]|uniref:LytR C-terminal domain-containing protein n=1 Tax=Arthrobacter sp. ISL-30 TaxID=2819109 RepID=UPI001BE50FC6|nr:LytR C-terminal domain-containing protein [Arthrobacter sp. ISL-30]MBT2514177.1 LytR C-terminal domain-containing protein [Arthrobacter sp. ISL-30]